MFSNKSINRVLAAALVPEPEIPKETFYEISSTSAPGAAKECCGSAPPRTAMLAGSSRVDGEIRDQPVFCSFLFMGLVWSAAPAVPLTTDPSSNQHNTSYWVDLGYQISARSLFIGSCPGFLSV